MLVRRFAWWAGLVPVLVLGPGAVLAEVDPWSPLPPAAESGAAGEKNAKKESAFKKWDEVLKDSEAHDGVFTLHKKREEIYAEITREDFERDYLVALSVGSGIGSNFLLGGLPFGTKLVQFRRVEDHVQLVEPNTRFEGGSDPALQDAVELSYGASVLASFEIESEKDTTGTVLVNFGKFLVSDYPDLAFFLGLVLDSPVNLDASRTRIAGFKNFPENVEFDVEYTLSPMNRRQVYLASVIDNRYIPVTIHYSLSVLPEETGFVPRLADPRVGYFLTAMKDFSEGTEAGYFQRFSNRWNLQKKDPHRLVSEPVEPIVYYIDRTVPAEYRQYVKEGIEAWQAAYEAAGFKNAIVARDHPEDDPDFDPEDVRYNTIRWITSNEPSFAAIGPSRVDPRTGQILDADVLIEDSFVLSIKNGYRRLVRPRDLASATSFPAGFLDPTARRLLETPALPEEFKQHFCFMGSLFDQNASLLGLSLLSNGLMGPGDEVPAEYVGQALRWVVMHEVGHTLGLRHNFKSSVDVPVEKLNDRQYVAAHGLTGSVMDYAPPNISLDPAAQGYYYGPGLGTYDIWAIRYGYTPFGAERPEDEWADLMALAAESGAPGHTYATDEDTYTPWAPDPTSNIFDLGSDPLTFAEQRAQLVDRIMKSPEFEELILTDGDGYPKLRRAMMTLIFNRFSSVTAAFKYVGGAYISRDHRGTPNADPPITAIPGAEQRRALEFIFAQAFRDETFGIPAPVLDRLAIDRWTHWGTASWTDRFDFPLHDWAALFHNATVTALLSPAPLARMLEAEHKYPDAITIAELFDRMSGEVWREIDGPAASRISSFRRDLQRAHAEQLVRLAVDPPEGTPVDAQALARLHIERLERRIGQVLERARADDTVSAHLRMVRTRFQRALEAELGTRL